MRGEYFLWNLDYVMDCWWWFGLRSFALKGSDVRAKDLLSKFNVFDGDWTIGNSING